MGRPIEWTDEKIEAEADYLLEWARLDDSLVLGSCYADRCYSYQDAIDWSVKNEKFREAKKRARTFVGSRREKGGIQGSLDSAIVRSSMGTYDPEHRAFLIEMKKCGENALQGPVKVEVVNYSKT